MTGRPTGPMRQRPRRSPIVLIAAIVGLVGLVVGLNSQVVETLLPGTLASVARASSQAVQDASVQPLIELASEPSAVDAVLARMPEQQAQAATSSSSSVPCHTVQRGDTLFALARRFGTTVEAIVAANNLCSSRILVGQKLQIPVSAAPCPPVSAACPTVCPPVSVPVCAPTRVVVSQPVCPPTRVVISQPVCPAPQVVVSVPVCQPVVCVPVVCVPVCQPVVCAPVCRTFVDP